MAHKSQEQLSGQIEKAREAIKIGSLYCHYKHPGKLYIVESVGFFEETEEICVCYRALYSKGILWIRSLGNFLEKVEMDGKMVRRFCEV